MSQRRPPSQNNTIDPIFLIIRSVALLKYAELAFASYEHALAFDTFAAA